jgi:hypothetical protein
MPVQLLNQQSSLLLTRERDFLSLLGSPLKNRSHITVVYESTMSYQLRYTASPPEGQAFSAGTCCWAPDPVYYSKRLLHRSFPNQRDLKLYRFNTAGGMASS